MVNTLNRVGPPPTARSVATQAAIPTATALAGRYGEAPPEDEGALPDELREIFDAYDALRRAQGGQ
jgi:hypothetical protein